jgi:hypothetical protein
VALLAGASGASAQQPSPLTFDPPLAGEGTALLASLEQPAQPMTLTLPKGTRVDTASVEQLCPRGAGALCPDTSHIGFGRYIVSVRNFASWGGDADLTWSISASLGQPVRRGDAAAVVLTAKLLGIDSVTAFLGPALGTVPTTSTTVARLVPRSSGVELRLPSLPVRFTAPSPVTIAPSRLELQLSAVRRTRQNFTRRIRVRTLSGYEVRKIRDHRLIGHYLFRAPKTCSGAWSSEVRAAAKRTASRITCSKA